MKNVSKRCRILYLPIAALAMSLGSFTLVHPAQSVLAEANDHSHANMTAWEATDSLPTEAGSYYLTNDVILTAKWSAPAGTTNLCLNGHFIKQTSKVCVMEAIGSNRILNLYDCDETLHYYYIDSQTRLGVVVDSEEDAVAGNADKHGTFKGGYLTGGYGRNRAGTLTAGGGIFLESNSNVTLENVTMIGNHGDFGGAFHNTDSILNLNGGYIIGNTGAGSAVNMDKNNGKTSYCNIVDTIITNNDSGIRNCGTYTTLSGKLEIFNNDNKEDGTGYDLQPTSVFKIGETLENTHPMVTYYHASFVSPFTSGLNGKGDASNFACRDADYYVKVNNDGEAYLAPVPTATVTLSDGTVNDYDSLSSAVSAWTDGSTLKLHKDVTGQISMSEGTKTLDLNDHSLTNAIGDIITITGGKLEIKDSSASKTTHYYTPNDVGPASLSDQETDYSFEGGYIGKTDGRGVVISSGEVVLSSGTIFGNSGGSGAGIKAGTGTKLTIEGTGAVIGNYQNATKYPYTSAGGISLDGTLTMTGGRVSDNTAETGNGGIRVTDNASFTMTGGEVTGNLGHSWLAGGIHVDGKASVSLGGSAKIYGNYFLTTDKNLGFNTDNPLTIVSPFTKEARIDIFPCLDKDDNSQGGATFSSPIVFTKNWSDVMGDEDPYNYFKCDAIYKRDGKTLVTKYEIFAKNGQGAAAPVSYTVSFDGNSGTGTMGNVVSSTRAYALPENSFTAPEGMRFLGWKYNGDIYAPGASILLSSDATIVAQWAPVPEEGWLKLSGTVYQVGGIDPAIGATVRLIKGNEIYDFTTVDANGKYQFECPNGTYNIVVEYNGTCKTTLVEVDDVTVKDITLSIGNTESVLNVDSNVGVTVGGLDKEADDIRAAEGIPADKDVTVSMNVEQKPVETAAHADEIVETAPEKNFEFYEIKVEKTIDKVTTTLDTTTNVLEIVVPYENVNKREVAVYSYHDGETKTYTMSNTKEDGTFSIDKDNGVVRIYTRNFSTFGIGYTPYYDVSASITLGSYKGVVTASLENKATKEVITLEDVALDQVVFTDLKKGEYLLTITWFDGVTNTITMNVTIG